MGRGAAGGDGPRPRRKGACGAEGGREKRYPRPRPPPATRYAVRGRLRGDAVASPGTAAADARRRRSERPAVGAEVTKMRRIVVIPAKAGISCRKRADCNRQTTRSEEHTSELQPLMRISYAVFCLQKKKPKQI